MIFWLMFLNEMHKIVPVEKYKTTVLEGYSQKNKKERSEKIGLTWLDWGVNTMNSTTQLTRLQHEENSRHHLTSWIGTSTRGELKTTSRGPTRWIEISTRSRPLCWATSSQYVVASNLLLHVKSPPRHNLTPIGKTRETTETDFVASNLFG